MPAAEFETRSRRKVDEASEPRRCSAQFREREGGEAWVTRQIERGHIIVTRSRTPYEVSHTSVAGEELEIAQEYIAVDLFLAAL